MSTHIIFVKIVQNSYVYDNFIVTEDKICRSLEVPTKLTKPIKKVRLCVDAIVTHYCIRELQYGLVYRYKFIDFYRDGTAVQVVLRPAREIIDYKWSYRMEHLVRERCELEHTLSWLSTLGGAFSALGDYFSTCAEMAGKISLNQLKLALRLDDPSIVSRCRLYVGLSLIQQRRFKLAQFIVYREYVSAKASSVIDIRLINMCKGIWCKLKYDYELCRREKHVCSR